VPRVLLVRHGHTLANADRSSAELVRGWLDVDLDERGRLQARRVAKKLSAYDVVEVYCSPLHRARETAGIIAEACAVALRTPSVSLMPWNLGELQGEPVDQVLEDLSRYVHHPDVEVPGGEPFARFRDRFLDYLQRKCNEASKLDEQQCVVLVTHGRCLLLAREWLDAGGKDDRSLNVDEQSDYLNDKEPGGVLALRVGA
jgi:2,3-bisphosphoglycerate-dependent phosphoglycerate mutase